MDVALGGVRSFGTVRVGVTVDRHKVGKVTGWVAIGIVGTTSAVALDEAVAARRTAKQFVVPARRAIPEFGNVEARARDLAAPGVVGALRIERLAVERHIGQGGRLGIWSRVAVASIDVAIRIPGTAATIAVELVVGTGGQGVDLVPPSFGAEPLGGHVSARVRLDLADSRFGRIVEAALGQRLAERRHRVANVDDVTIGIVGTAGTVTRRIVDARRAFVIPVGGTKPAFRHIHALGGVGVAEGVIDRVRLGW